MNAKILASVAFVGVLVALGGCNGGSETEMDRKMQTERTTENVQPLDAPGKEVGEMAQDSPGGGTGTGKR